MKVGYVRVSTKEQNTKRQEVMMANLGVDKIYIEKVTGKNQERPELKAMLEFVRDGDMVVVESYSRFSRNLKDILLLMDLLDNKGVKFVSLKENVDTSTPQGRLMMSMFGSLAEFERDCMLQRQREGIDIAIEEGRFKGRPTKELADFEKLYCDWKNKRVKVTDICREHNISRSTWYVMLT